MTQEKLSVCINSHNAEAYIRECLESVTWADEIVVQDCSSTDQTVNIVREYTDKIFIVPNDPVLPNANYNGLFERATHPWILFLNEDERISPELRDEILILLADHLDCSGYRIPRRNLMLGRWIENGMFAPEAAPQLRLFRRGQGRFACKHVHEDLQVDGAVGLLRGQLLHDHIRTAHDYLRRIAWYGTDEAETYLKEVNGQLSWRDLILVPTRSFALNFFVNHGYRDGVSGLAVSLLYAMEHLAAVLRAWDLADHWAKVQKPEQEGTHFRNAVMFWLIRAWVTLARAFSGTTAVGTLVRRMRDRFRSNRRMEQ